MKIKLKLNKQIVSRLTDIKGGTEVTKTCDVVYSMEPIPIPVPTIPPTPTKVRSVICETDACLPSEDTNLSTCKPSIYMCTVYNC